MLAVITITHFNNIFIVILVLCLLSRSSNFSLLFKLSFFFTCWIIWKIFCFHDDNNLLPFLFIIFVSSFRVIIFFKFISIFWFWIIFFDLRLFFIRRENNTIFLLCFSCPSFLGRILFRIFITGTFHSRSN